MVDLVFILGLIVHAFLLVMMLLSARQESFQFWPPPSKNSWQYHSLWWGIRILVACIGWLIYAEHSTLNLPDWLRFYVAMPCAITLFVLGTIAAKQLGWANTHGIADRFIRTGFYRYSRNPQYVFYALGFLCLGIWAASLKALILLLLLSVWYLRARFSEEKWLEAQYGREYLDYKNKVPRYWRWSKHSIPRRKMR